MDNHLRKISQLHIERTIKSLQNNRMDAEFIPDPAALLRRLEEIIPAGAEIASGGSMTLAETGVEAWMNNGNYQYYAAGNIHSGGYDLEITLQKAHFCDWFFMSSNAVTEYGELYNVDGNGNRVSALINGPKHVVVVVGANKLVPDLAAAETRVKTISAPANAVRLGRVTGCSKTGYCVDCKTEARVCCHTVISSYQRHPGRIHVFILPDSYGY